MTVSEYDKKIAEYATYAICDSVVDIGNIPEDCDKKTVIKIIMKCFGLVNKTTYWKEEYSAENELEYWKPYSAMMKYLCEEVRNKSKEYGVVLPS